MKALKPLCFLTSFFSVLMCSSSTLEPLLHFALWLFIQCWPEKKVLFHTKRKNKKSKILTGLTIWKKRELWTNCHWQHTCSHSYFRADSQKVNFETLRWPIYIINSVNKTEFSCYISPQMQHHSFFRNLLPSFNWKNIFSS